jgi:hypothetical protein
MESTESEMQSWRDFWEIVGAEAYRIWMEERQGPGSSGAVQDSA